MLLFSFAFGPLVVPSIAAIVGLAFGCFLKAKPLLILATLLSLVAFAAGYAVTSGICAVIGI